MPKKKKNKVKPYTPNDKFFYRAKEQGFRARSAFKLQEIENKFHLLKPRDVVLDIGAAPGSFLQVASEIVGKRGLLIGMDLKPIEPFSDHKNIHTFVCDVFQHDEVRGNLESLALAQVDVILSDIAPNTSGISDVDQWRSVELNLEILKVADMFLKPGGNLLLKVFHGEDFPQLIAAVKERFERTKVFKPSASRERSVEMYIVAYCKNNKKVV